MENRDHKHGLATQGLVGVSCLPPLTPCPWLPLDRTVVDASCLAPFGKSDRGAEFYLAALTYAQSLWLEHRPAQSLLLLNRALGADVAADHEILQIYPLPYRAVAWVLQNRLSHQFIGNPRRHYQHLATRMVEPRKKLRAWRAWACWLLACLIYPECPPDDEQLLNEQIAEPDEEAIAHALRQVGHSGESGTWSDLLKEVKSACAVNLLPSQGHTTMNRSVTLPADG